MPVAVNCLVKPLTTEIGDGVTAMETSVAEDTVIKADSVVSSLETPPNEAEMVVEPVATVVAIPFDPTAFEIVALVMSLEDQVTEVVIF